MQALSATKTQFAHPIAVQATDKNGRWSLRSLSQDDVPEMKQLMMSNAFAFYRNGAPFTEEQATNRCKTLIGRCNSGDPFTGFAVRNAAHKLIGLFVIGYDDDPRKLQVAGMGLPEYQHQGIGKEVLAWALHRYLPKLHAAGFRLPIRDANNHVKEWVDLKDSAVVATVHPDYTHCNHLLQNAGFHLRETTFQPGFVGAHDGRRNVYEIAVRALLRS